MATDIVDPDELESLRLAAEAGDIVRETAKQYLGGNCTFVCGDIKMLGVLAQRAVLAGLHGDMHSPRTRQNMERAAEAARAEHEAAIGQPIWPAACR